MTQFLNWKYVSQDQTIQLENLTTVEDVKSAFIEIFSLQALNEEKRIILLNFHINNYIYCKEHAFNYEKTSTFLSMMYDVFQRDTNLSTSENSVLKSFQRFEEILLKHSVDRSPKSIKIFDREDIEPIIDYASERYFRNFIVYCSIFGKISRVQIKQVTRNQIEEPRSSFPLLKSAIISR